MVGESGRGDNCNGDILAYFVTAAGWDGEGGVEPDGQERGSAQR
jgi:hypothetical protein